MRKGIRCVVFLACALVLARAANPPAAGSGKVSGGFKAPVFDEKGELRSQFEGESFRPLKDGRFLITKFVLKTFREKNRPDMTALAEECFFRQSDHSASSAKALKVTQADGRLELVGEGFEWRQKTGQLVISNSVQAQLRQASGPRAIEAGIRVKSDRLDYDSRQNIAVFTGNVVAEQPGRIRVECGLLTARLGSEGSGFERIEAETGVKIALTEGAESYSASGDNAVFISDRGTNGMDRLELRGGASWNARGMEGGADEVVLVGGSPRDGSAVVGTDSTPLSFEARGSARFRMPQPGEGSGAVRKWVDITSQNYTFRNAQAKFEGNVVARSESQWALRAGKLDVHQAASTNRIERIVAQDAVEIDLLDAASPGNVRGSRAEFTESDGLLAMDGLAEWRLRDYRGRGEALKIKIRSTSPDVSMKGPSVLVLPGQALMASGLIPDLSGNAAVPAGEVAERVLPPAEVASQGMVIRENRVVFMGPVRVTSAAGLMEARSLGVQLASDGKRVEKLVADGEVAIRQGEDRLTARHFVAEMAATNKLDRMVAEGAVRFFSTRGGKFMQGQGERLTLTTTNQQAVLEGKPSFSTETGILAESEEPVSWDLATRKFRLKNYFISGNRDSLRRNAPVAPKAP